MDPRPYLEVKELAVAPVNGFCGAAGPRDPDDVDLQTGQRRSGLTLGHLGIAGTQGRAQGLDLSFASDRGDERLALLSLSFLSHKMGTTIPLLESYKGLEASAAPAL